MTTATRTAPSPADKAEMILKHFPALKPRFNADAGRWECPSMSDRHVVHTITAHKHGADPVVRTCDCLSRARCTHLELVELATGGQLVHGEALHYMTMREFDQRHAYLMQSGGA